MTSIERSVSDEQNSAAVCGVWMPAFNKIVSADQITLNQSICSFGPAQYLNHKSNSNVYQYTQSHQKRDLCCKKLQFGVQLCKVMYIQLVVVILASFTTPQSAADNADTERKTYAQSALQVQSRKLQAR